MARVPEEILAAVEEELINVASVEVEQAIRSYTWNRQRREELRKRRFAERNGTSLISFEGLDSDEEDELYTSDEAENDYWNVSRIEIHHSN